MPEKSEVMDDGPGLSEVSELADETLEPDSIEGPGPDGGESFAKSLMSSVVGAPDNGPGKDDFAEYGLGEAGSHIADGLVDVIADATDTDLGGGMPPLAKVGAGVAKFMSDMDTSGGSDGDGDGLGDGIEVVE